MDQYDNPSAPANTKRRRRRGSLALGLALVVLGLMALAAVGGFVLANRTVVAARMLPEPRATPLPSVAAVGGSVMPDVRGLTPADARQVLADAGIAAASVTTSTIPAAGPPGVVAKQSPVFGTASPGAVRLAISEAASMPALVGRSYAYAVAQLGALQATVTKQLRYDPGARVGDVVETRPAKGAALSGTVTVTVAAPPASRFLTGLAATRSGCSGDDTLLLSNTTYAQGVTCDAQQESTGAIWLLSGKVDRFRALVGIPDDTDTPTAAPHLEVIVDGKVAADVTPRLGHPVQVDVPTTGAVQLTLRALSADGTGTIGLGDPALLGSSAAIAALPSS